MKRILLATVLLCLSSLMSFGANQAPLQPPTTGPMSATTFTSSHLNPALLAIATQNWGPSVPANGPGSVAALFQTWMDTSGPIPTFKFYDGAQWATLARLDTVTHSWVTDPDVCVADNTLVSDTYLVLQACLDARKKFKLRDGDYKITSQLALNSGQVVDLGPNVTIRQYTREARIFYGANISNVEIRGGVLQGEGSFCGNVGQTITAACPTGEWSGNGGDNGHNDRAIQLDNCTNCSIKRVHTKNTGTAGIAIFGGNGITIDDNFTEGTHLYSTPITAQSNFQDGILLADHPTWGAIDNLLVTNNRVTGVAQGVSQSNFGVTNTSNLARQISNLNVYDIPGQHAYYGSSGNFALNVVYCTNIVDACVKNQIALPGYDSNNFSAHGVVADNIGSNMFEVTVLIGATGSQTHNVSLSGVGRGIGRGLAAVGPVTNLTANVQARTTSGEVVYISGDGPRDFDITLQSTDSQIDGVLVTATNADRIRFHHPIIRQPNISNTGRFGILVSSASANVTLFDPVVLDANVRMVNGISNAVVGGTIRVLGSVSVIGASGTCISAAGVFTAWPIQTTLSCTGGPFTGASNIVNADIGSPSVPYSDLYLGLGKRINFANGGITITESGDSLYFQDAASYQFGNNVYPVSNRTSALGISARGWTQLCLDGSINGTGCLLPPSAASTFSWTLPAATTTLLGTDNTATVSNKSISGASNTLTNIGNSSLTNSSTQVNGQTCALGSPCTVGMTVGTTTISSGTSFGVNYNNAGVLGNTAAGTNGQLFLGITSGAPAWATMSGDAMITNAGVVTLTSTISAGGPIGSGTVSPSITWDAKGRLTAVSGNTITPAIGNVTGLGTSVATALAVNVGTAGAFVVNGGALGSPSSAGTMPAFTLGGTVSGGGNNINSVNIGVSLPGTGAFTTLTASTSVASPIHSAAGLLSFQSNGSTFAGSIDTSQRWSIASTSGLTAPTGVLLNINANTAALTAINAPTLQLAAADANATRIALHSFGDGTTIQPAIQMFHAANSNASKTATKTGSRLGSVAGYGYGGAGYVTNAGAAIIMQSSEAGDYTTTAAGAHLDVLTTPIGTASIAIAARFQNSGGLSIGTTSDPGLGMLYTNSATFMHRTKTSWSNGASVGAGTLTTAPVAGNPTKWIPVDDNGTTRYIPAW